MVFSVQISAIVVGSLKDLSWLSNINPKYTKEHHEQGV
jgi:hypothetical protein